MSKIRTCDELGVCNGRHCHDVAACPDFDLIACNSCDCGVSERVPCPHAVFECELPCSPEPARPTYPFAPGTIEGPARPAMTRRSLWFDLVWLLGSVGALGMLAGYMLERFA